MAVLEHRRKAKKAKENRQVSAASAHPAAHPATHPAAAHPAAHAAPARSKK